MEKYEKPEMEIVEFDEAEVKILTSDDTPSAPLNTKAIFSNNQSY